MATRGRKSSGKTKNQLSAESKARMQTKNVSLDAELLALIHDANQKLSEKYGFDLTIKQTLKHILGKGGKAWL